MMDTKNFAEQPSFDLELLQEFYDSLTDRAPQIEHDISQLRNTRGDKEASADLFRAMHTIKGDAALCRFSAIVRIIHPIESVLTRYRNGEIPFSDLLAEVVLLAIDRIELAVETALSKRDFRHLKLEALTAGLERLSQESVSQLETAAARLIESITGFRPSTHHEDHFKQQQYQPEKVNPPGPNAKNIQDDLIFFRSLANQLEHRSTLFKGRTMRVLRLALETNKEKGNLIDPLQLEAAVYLHDIGMMFLPESAWLKVGQMSFDDKQALRNHPGYAAGLLQRMPGWKEAAEMVAQHHEMPDGKGYPRGLTDESITAGAKILAIVDAFEAVMLKHSHRGKNRSVLRAIAEINACDKQFAPEWIGPFNAVIRKTLES